MHALKPGFSSTQSSIPFMFTQCRKLQDMDFNMDSFVIIINTKFVVGGVVVVDGVDVVAAAVDGVGYFLICST